MVFDLKAQYSKWDHFNDDENDSEEESSQKKPSVTRLDATSSVRLGSEGWTVVPKEVPKNGLDYSRWDKILEDESDGEGEPNAYYEDEIWHKRRQEAMSEATVDYTQKKTNPHPLQATLDGGHGLKNDETLFVWSQTATEVTIRIATKAKRANEIHLSITFDAESSRRCLFRLDDGFGQLSATFKYDIWCRGDDRPTFTLVDDETHRADLTDDLDWSLEPSPIELNQNPKCIRISLIKRPPAPGLTIWWSRLFEPAAPASLFYEDDIDTTSLQARRQLQTSQQPRKSPEKFQKAWEEAHAAFLQKVKHQREKASSSTADDYIDASEHSAPLENPSSS